MVSLGAAPVTLAGPEGAPTSSTPAVSTADLKALVNELQDAAARQKLIADIQALIAVRDRQNQAPAIAQPAPAVAAGNPGDTVIAAASQQVRNVSDALVGATGVLLDLPRLSTWVRQQAADRGTRDLVIGTLLRFIAILAGALAAERAASLMLKWRRKPAVEGAVEPPWLGTIFLLGGVLKDVLSVSAFAATAYLLLPLTHPSDAARPVLLVLLIATASLRGLLAVGHRLLAPEEGSRRPLGMSADSGSYWFVWLRRFAVLLVGGYGAAYAALLVGLPPAGFEFILKAVGFVVAALVVMLILQNRESVRDRIRGQPGSAGQGGLQVLRSRAAEMWHVAAMIYVAAIFGVWAFQVPGGFSFILRASVLSAVAIAAAKILADLAANLLHRFFSIGRELHLRFPGLEERAGRYLPVLTISLRVALYAAAGLTVLQAWGLDSFA